MQSWVGVWKLTLKKRGHERMEVIVLFKETFFMESNFLLSKFFSFWVDTDVFLPECSSVSAGFVCSRLRFRMSSLQRSVCISARAPRHVKFNQQHVGAIKAISSDRKQLKRKKINRRKDRRRGGTKELSIRRTKWRRWWSLFGVGYIHLGTVADAFKPIIFIFFLLFLKMYLYEF